MINLTLPLHTVVLPIDSCWVVEATVGQQAVFVHQLVLWVDVAKKGDDPNVLQLQVLLLPLEKGFR